MLVLMFWKSCINLDPSLKCIFAVHVYFIWNCMNIYKQTFFLKESVWLLFFPSGIDYNSHGVPKVEFCSHFAYIQSAENGIFPAVFAGYYLLHRYSGYYGMFALPQRFLSFLKLRKATVSFLSQCFWEVV